MKKIGEIIANGETLDVVRTSFPNGAACIVLTDAIGALSARISVNVPEVSPYLSADLFLAKTYSENQLLRAPLLGSGLFTDTGERIDSGFVQLEIWKINF